MQGSGRRGKSEDNTRLLFGPEKQIDESMTSSQIPKEKDTRQFMQEALAEAQRGLERGEVPVGAIAVRHGNIIARAHNEVEMQQDATLHAEMLVLRRAAQYCGAWRLTDIDIFVSLEPCPMCASALLLSRVNSVYFAAKDERMGAYGSLFHLGSHPALRQTDKIYGGLLEAESKQLLQSFFRCRRESS